MPQAPSLRPWVRITFLGWLLGIVLVVALALILPVIGMTKSLGVG